MYDVMGQLLPRLLPTNNRRQNMIRGEPSRGLAFFSFKNYIHKCWAKVDSQSYKIKVEYCVSAAVLTIAFLFFRPLPSKPHGGYWPADHAVNLGFIFIRQRYLAGHPRLYRPGRRSKDGYGFLESDVGIFMVIGCGMLFVTLFWGFGYFTALIFTFIAMLYTFGVRNWAIMIIGAIILLSPCRLCLWA